MIPISFLHIYKCIYISICSELRPQTLVTVKITVCSTKTGHIGGGEGKGNKKSHRFNFKCCDFQIKQPLASRQTMLSQKRLPAKIPCDIHDGFHTFFR